MLPPKQARFLGALRAGLTVRQASRRARVHRATGYRWAARLAALGLR